jgi:protease II
LHGEWVSDDYAWMGVPNEPALREYLTAERTYYDAHAERLAPLAGRLAEEAASRIPSGPEHSVRWPRGGFAYRTRMPEGSENLQLLRSREGQ